MFVWKIKGSSTCKSLICQNGGTCVNDVTIGFEFCNCSSGYYGQQCQVFESLFILFIIATNYLYLRLLINSQSSSSSSS